VNVRATKKEKRAATVLNLAFALVLKQLTTPNDPNQHHGYNEHDVLVRPGKLLVLKEARCCCNGGHKFSHF